MEQFWAVWSDILFVQLKSKTQAPAEKLSHS